jgi:hypothetical protein
MRHDKRAIFDSLDDLPLNEKLAFLVASCLVDDAAVSTEILVDLALVMAKRLPESSQRTRLAWHLNAAATELSAKWN